MRFRLYFYYNLFLKKYQYEVLHKYMIIKFILFLLIYITLEFSIDIIVIDIDINTQVLIEKMHKDTRVII